MFDIRRAVHRKIIPTVKPTRCTSISNLFQFGNHTLRASYGLPVLHREFETAHTATGIYRTVNPEMDKITTTYIHIH